VVGAAFSISELESSSSLVIDHDEVLEDKPSGGNRPADLSDLVGVGVDVGKGLAVIRSGDIVKDETYLA
jgi:hypothetical protein